MRIIVYLDDFLIVNKNADELGQQVSVLLNTLSSLGFKINSGKSVIEPTQFLTYLGVNWDTNADLKSLPAEKIQDLESSISKIIERRTWNWKQAKSLLGKMEFASFVIPLARLHCRRMQRSLKKLQRGYPSRQVTVSPKVMQDLTWWMENLTKSSPIHLNEPEVHLSTDASDAGWGAQLGDSLLAGEWSIPQRQWHINKKEMFVIYLVILKHLAQLKDKSILIQTDNKTVVSYLRRQGGTRSITLLELTEKILELANQQNLVIRAEHIPGNYNTVSDHLSRRKELPDWHLSKRVQEMICGKWGLPAIDLFATERSAVTTRFVSQFQCREAEFVNAFTRSISKDIALRRKWLDPMGVTEASIDVPQYKEVCSDHFKSSDFGNTTFGKKRLKKNALNTLYPKEEDTQQLEI
nr:unnamed protein product [Callosobruchus chinensis]